MREIGDACGRLIRLRRVACCVMICRHADVAVSTEGPTGHHFRSLTGGWRSTTVRRAAGVTAFFIDGPAARIMQSAERLPW